MSAIPCFLWWLVLGALLGLLASWLLGMMFRRPAPRPIERVVEKTVDKFVDNPAHLARIKALEGEVGAIAGLRSQISQLQSAPAKVVERIVEKPVEKIVQDTQGIEQRDQKIRELQTRFDDLDRRSRGHVQTIADRDEELRRLRLPPIIDVNAAKAAGLPLKSADDLEIIEGIGPKIAELLRADGITTFFELSNSTPDKIRAILDKAGPNFRVADPGTWPEQADLAAHNRWRALKSLQDILIAGHR
jgi:predicted flap endonuclease-1-like 5' DNA nuclease